MTNPLPKELIANLRSVNPWWSSRPGQPVPEFKRWAFRRLRESLIAGPAPATVVRGPRQVGKTTLLEQLRESLQRDRVPGNRILFVEFDDLPTLGDLREPILEICRWFEAEILGRTFNESAHRDEPVYLFFDEIQNVASWAPELKNLVDNHAVRVFATGSSALHIEAGRDSLAGRISSLDLGPLLLREIAELQTRSKIEPYWVDNGLDALATQDFWTECGSHSRRHALVRGEAYRAFSERGGFPFAQVYTGTHWYRIADHLNETIVRRAIQHDLERGPSGRRLDAQLLENVFRLSCRYAGQTPGKDIFVPEISSAIGGVTWERIRTYLSHLDSALLLRLVPAIELRGRRQAAPAKICLCDHALRAAWLQEVVPLEPVGLEKDPHLSVIAGHIAEGIVGAFLMSIPGLQVAHKPPHGNEPEVDFVITIGTRRVPVEVKFRTRIDPFEDTRGLRAFLENTVYNAPFALLVTLHDDVNVPDPRVVTLSLSSLLWLR